MSEGQIALIISGISSLITLSIAIAAWISVSATKRTAQAQLYRSHFEIYASGRMEDALRELERLQEDPKWEKLVKEYPKGGLEFIKALGDLYKGRVTSDRRYVKYYFTSALKLRKLKFIRRKVLKKLLYVAGIDLLYDVVKLLEVDPRARKHIEEIRKICGRYEKESEKG